MITINAGSSVRLLGQLGVNLTGFMVNFVFEQVNPVSADSSGYVIGLSGNQVQTRVATVVNAQAGLAAYTLTSSDTMTPGNYRAQFVFTDSSGQQQFFPNSGWLWVDIQAFAAPTLFSALADFYEPVRAIMGDFRKPVKFEDASIASVVRLVVRGGRVPNFSITADAMKVSPALTRPADFALLVYWSARTLLRPNVRGESWSSRAMKVRRSDQRDFLFELENLLYYAENPAQLASFQSYYAWVNSLAGINVWGLMTEMKVQGPVAEAIIGTAGIQINTT